jgi:phenylpropionate dioxygenase-like ring-hydroxylating dioxygenase large terminal subunit
MAVGKDQPPSRDRHRASSEPERELLYPSSWFFLALFRELPPGRVLIRRLADEDVVLYRTADGRPHAVRPYCPHLGAHFGSGGTVEGQNLVCPFHHFAFFPDGTCVSTPDGRPPRARVEHHTIRERDGFVFGWYAPDGTPAAWDAPAPPHRFMRQPPGALKSTHLCRSSPRAPSTTGTYRWCTT